MALDIGERFIGVAISDPLGVMAQPLTVLKRKGNAYPAEGDAPQSIHAIEEIIRVYNISRVIAGVPLSLDNKETAQTRKVEAFTLELAKRLGVPVEVRDEALTTQRARKLMLVTHKRKARRKTRDDAIAASYMLQDYLDERGTK